MEIVLFIIVRMPDSMIEPARTIPLITEADVCVLGGSCTGVFAAIRAAQTGARVVLVEKAGCFGGVATLSLVNVWHSLFDEVFERKIIGGLSEVLMDRLRQRKAVKERARSPDWQFAFNPAEMQIELDALILEAGVEPMLHTVFSAPWLEQERLAGVIVENKDGRGLIKARYFIDATGDGDLCHRLGHPTYVSERFQPSTTCALFEGWPPAFKETLSKLLRKHRETYGLPHGFAWGATVPDTQLFMLAGTRVAGLDCSTATGLTRAEMEGRRQVRAIQDLIREQAPDESISLVGLPARIGIRETRHVRCRHRLTGDDVLYGRRFDDAIANGSYRVDIHHVDRPGITLRYLDGREAYVCPGEPVQHARWRVAEKVMPTFYQIPYRCLLPGSQPNLLLAGRMIDADPQAHGAIRVMINMNQTGEAAGVAAALACRDDSDVRRLDPSTVRRALSEGGSVII